MAVRRSFRMGLWLGLLAGVLVAILKVVQARREGGEPEVAEWPPLQPTPTSSPEKETIGAPVPTAIAEQAPATEAPREVVKASPARRTAKKTAKKAVKAKKVARKAVRKAWVEPDDGVCPPSHPVKAKLSSGLFHLPGMVFYNRTRADRCYADEDSAVQDGLTKAKR